MQEHDHRCFSRAAILVPNVQDGRAHVRQFRHHTLRAHRDLKIPSKGNTFRFRVPRRAAASSLGSVELSKGAAFWLGAWIRFGAQRVDHVRDPAAWYASISGVAVAGPIWMVSPLLA